MISDADMNEIEPPASTTAPSAAHVESGIPVPKSIRVQNFSPSEWEAFTEEWACSLKPMYSKVRRFGGAGDLGVDIAGFCSQDGFEGEWDNYQCKQYAHPLRPSDVWVEIGKVIYYSHLGQYRVPRSYFFVASRGIGTSLEKLLNRPADILVKLKVNWDGYCKTRITTTAEVILDGALLQYLDEFDFSIFSSKSHTELIEGHAQTPFHAVRFGGGLPPRPEADLPPDNPSPAESRYVRQLLDAYGDHLGAPLAGPGRLSVHSDLNRDFLRQRERFYHAESLRNFARDTVPEGTFDALQEEIFHGVVDTAEGTHPNGLDRMRATVAKASQVVSTANALSSVTKIQDRQGICHQLANDDRLVWVPDHD
jgi:hypothetical protein